MYGSILMSSLTMISEHWLSSALFIVSGSLNQHCSAVAMVSSTSSVLSVNWSQINMEPTASDTKSSKTHSISYEAAFDHMLLAGDV